MVALFATRLSPLTLRLNCANVANIQHPYPFKFSYGNINRFSNTAFGVKAGTKPNGLHVNDGMISSSSLPPVPRSAHRVVMMRHGESEFNNANVFTGWCDVALTPRGVVEAVEAGQVFASHGLSFRRCYSSLLTRSIATANRSLEAAGIAYTPMSYDWRLNERHYGALQGLSKDRTADRLGRHKVMRWRRSYGARPPLMTPEHPHFEMIESDGRYRYLRRTVGITRGESLEDCQKRVLQVWNDTIMKGIVMEGNDEALGDTDQYTLVVAHANTLRALVMHLDDIHPNAIEDVNIPTAIPFYYDFDTQTGGLVEGWRKKEGICPGGEMSFTGRYITDEMKKRSFLERRRTAHDPWLWALRDEQVAPDMLLEGDWGEKHHLDRKDNGDGIDQESLLGIEEAARNTNLFAKNLVSGATPNITISTQRST